MQYLLIDIGSTYTKLTLADTENASIVAQAAAITTIETSVMDGFNEALRNLKYKVPSLHYDKALICSSAAGGLKMVAIGLGRNLTAEAAKRAALGAGARVLKTYFYELTDKDINEINELNPDIILLSGGTNFGNYRNILNNAHSLLKLKNSIPIVVAGNEQVKNEVRDILSVKFETYVTENVMPVVNKLNPIPARSAIRNVFIKRIILAKGLKELKEKVGDVLMPTPDAVLHAAHLLQSGYGDIEGFGDLILIDIGGATTDIHSVGEGLPSSSSIKIKNATFELRYEGLREPFDKRTVEGDLGMRYSAKSLLEAVGKDELNSYYPADYEEECSIRSTHVKMRPSNEHDYNIEKSLAKACVKHGIARHAGKLRKEFTGVRNIYYMSGKDLSTFNTIIGTGGVLIHSTDTKKILELFEAPLYPTNPIYYKDKSYILSAMGLLSTVDPTSALIIMKKYLKEEI